MIGKLSWIDIPPNNRHIVAKVFNKEFHPTVFYSYFCQNVAIAGLQEHVDN